MSYTIVRPIGEVTSETRKAFVRLALLTEPRGTDRWLITGTEQATLHGVGSLHKSGNYLLRSVAKNWVRGSLAASSFFLAEQITFDLYKVKTASGVFVSSVPEALIELFPEAPLAKCGTGKLR